MIMISLIYSYDLLERPTPVYWDGGRDENFSEKFSENLSYDVSGNISSIAREFGKFDYSYDPTQQLTSSKCSGKKLLGNEVNRTWQYDLSGNRTNDSLRGAGYFVANGIAALYFLSGPGQFFGSNRGTNAGI